MSQPPVPPPSPADGGDDGTSASPPPPQSPPSSPYPPYSGATPVPPPPPAPGGPAGPGGPGGFGAPWPPPQAPGQPPYAPQAPGPSPYAPQAGSTQNTKAVIGLVAGIIGLVMAFCCSLLGVPLGLAATILGFLAKQEIASSGGHQAQSTGIAQGAFITGIIAMVMSVLMLILGAVANIGMGAADWNNVLD